ncbi:MAG: AraC family transcriptional regulator [Polyangiaceae bacterium]
MSRVAPRDRTSYFKGMSRAPSLAARRLLPSDTLRALLEARDLMEHSFAEPLALDDLASAAGFSNAYFIRSFSRAFGMTPHRYLTRVRLQRAKALLGDPRSSVTAACFEVGFSSLGSFSTLFRRSVGCSPSQYRKETLAWAQVPGVLVPAAAAPGGAERVVVPSCFAFMFGAPT